MGQMTEQVTLLVDFLNTLDVEHGADLLDDRAAYAGWGRARCLDPGSAAEAGALRAAVRASLLGVAAPTFASRVPVVLAAGEGPRPAPVTVVEAVLAAGAALVLTGSWDRLRLCPADDCQQAFFDRSRNRSRVWCAMADCGNLAKARGYRARARGEGRAPAV